ncbi:hypothetical protein MLD38_033224 [Melastoma candidum]|uniref:Uncharacterized protein n=1 Tax=Melastoma candidum TaxID=119954 RepID=A0ACB9M629_9MYRT|nr:hypothetical protein MLD38_033224 [Melastoma candidum]
MAFSDHLTTVDPCTLRPSSFLDPWFSDALSHETETLTRALQMSLSSYSPSPFAASAATPSDTNTNNSSDTTTLTHDVVSPFLVPTPGLHAPAFGSNSSETAAAAPKQRQRKTGVSSGKVTKRKPRATKRSQTTFITADAANFRQMVQQVTGSRLGHLPTANLGRILRPEPHRPGNRFTVPSRGNLVSSHGDDACLASIGSCLPTLDTSAFLLDSHRQQDNDQHKHHRQQQELQQLQQEQQGMMEMIGQVGSVDMVSSPSALGEDFMTYGSIPTLESWNSM